MTHETKKFLKMSFVATLVALPFTTAFFILLRGWGVGAALGLVAALIAGLTMAHIADDFLSIRENKKLREQKKSRR